jgi:hypothetical protein
MYAHLCSFEVLLHRDNGTLGLLITVPNMHPNNYLCSRIINTATRNISWLSNLGSRCSISRPGPKHALSLQARGASQHLD